MKLSRSYVMGLGSGLILSALLAMLLPSVTINFGEKQGLAKNQDITQPGGTNSNSNAVTPSEQKPVTGTAAEKISEEKPSVVGSTSSSNGLKSTDLVNKGIFIIPAGASAEKIADLLLNESWITSKEEFLTYVKQKNLASKFRAGSFELSRGNTVEEIVNQLIK